MTVTVIRTVILYFVIVLGMRLMGKRQLGELQPTELVVALLISDLASIPMQDNGLPLLDGIIPILVLVALEILISCLMLKFPLISRLVGGTPMPVIKDGRIDETVMRRLRISVDDLAESLRQQNIFDLRQVQYAIAETNGHISAFCYPEFQSASVGDVTAPPPDTGMPVVVVSDGQISAWGLKLCDLDEAWLRQTLKKKKCALGDVFILTASKSGEVFLLTREELKRENRQQKGGKT